MTTNEPNIERKPKINKEFGLSFIFSILSSLLGFLFSFLAARFLESDGYGEVQYYLSVASLCSVFIVFGSDNFVIKRIQFEDDKKAAMARMYVFLLATSVLTLPIYFVVAYFGLNQLGRDLGVIFLIFVLAVMMSFMSLLNGFFTGISKNQIRTVLSGIIPHLGMIVFFAIHYLTDTLDLFIQLYIVYSAAFSLFTIIPFVATHVGKTSLRFTKSEIIQLATFALIWVCYNTTTPIANVIIGEAYEKFNVVGIFAISSQLLTVASLANGIIINISYPVFSKYAKEGDHEKLFKFYQTVTRVNMSISVPFYIAFVCEAANLYRFFGESYSGYDLILILLSCNAMVECVTGPCGSVLLMGGKEKENLICSVVKFVFYVGLIAVIINFTVYAAPIAALVSTFFANALKLFFVGRAEHRNFFNLKLIIPLVVIAAICAACFYPISFVTNQIVWAIVNCVVGLGLICAFLFLTPFKADRKFLFRDKSTLY